MPELRSVAWCWPLFGCFAQFGYCLKQELLQADRDSGSQHCFAIYSVEHQVFVPVKAFCCALRCWLSASQVESKQAFVRLLGAVLAESPTFNLCNLESSLSKH